MLNLIGLSKDEVTEAIVNLGEKPYRAKQMWHWIYCKGVQNFTEMTSFSEKLRILLANHFTLQRPSVSHQQLSNDGSLKWLLEVDGPNNIESVFIPEVDRGALCVSSQVGCTLNCSFCHTGTQKMLRNLTAGEILGQVMVAKDQYQDWKKPASDRKLTNIVMMGMGEPLFNYPEVSKALKIIMDPEGISLSKRRITLSTSGVIPMIEKVGTELGVGLAISLHAVTDEIRNKLVPINKKYPIEQLLNACRTYPGANNARRITFEYVMLKGINDSEADARELSRLLRDIHAKVNLIPFNTWPGSPYASSSTPVIQKFASILNNNKISAPIRVPRGRDIMAACGQLRSAKENKELNKSAARSQIK